MVDTARGSLGERPWGRTLATLAMRGGTEQLTLDAGGKRYCVAFDRGAIVGASSPLASDSAARVALTNHLTSSSQVAEISRRLAAAPERDEVELIAAVTHLTLEQTELLRRRAIAQRAARTFSLDEGAFSIDERIRIPFVRGIAVDVRAVVYLGARMNLSAERLAADLRELGTHFTLKREAFDDLPAFGFTASERLVLQALRAGASLPELEATHREIDPRSLQAMIYALATCDAVTCVTVARTPTPSHVSFKTRAPSPDLARAPTLRAPVIGRVGSRPQITRTPTGNPTVTRAPTPQQPALARAPTPAQPMLGRTPAHPAIARAPTPSAPEQARALADEAFARAEKALRAEQLDVALPELARAVELAPANVDYAAALAWVRFCAAADKVLVATETRKVLERAVYKSTKPALALFYLGRVERILGRDQAALRHFMEVLALQPKNEAAAIEIRVLEARIAANAKR